MSKSRLGIIFTLVLLATSITFAQSFFSSSSSSSTTPPKIGTTPSQPMQPSDFSTLVQQQSQTNQMQMNQQVTKAFQQQPFTPTTTAGVTPPPTTNPVPTPVPPPASSSTDNDNDTSDSSGSDQSQPYTGYQTPNTGNGPSSQKNGLSIKY